MPESLDLVGVAEIARMAGVSKQAVANWRARSDDFPKPLSELKSGPVWMASDIRAWAERRGIELRPVRREAQSDEDGGKKTMCITVAMTNMKGGVGKSTLAANLGWHGAYRSNKRVLLVDLDPQFNLSQYVLGTDGYEAHLGKEKPTIWDVFEQFTPTSTAKAASFSPADAIAQVRIWDDGSRLDLVPSRLELAWTLKNPHEKEQLLRDFLDEVRDEYDLILIDCAPTESMLTTASYLASDFLLVPVKPEFLSTIGLPLLVRSLEDFTKKHKKETPPKLAGVVFNATSASKVEHQRSRDFVTKLAKREKWYVFEKEVGFSDSYPAGARVGRPIFLTDYARSWKIAEFEAVAEEFNKRIGL